MDKTNKREIRRIRHVLDEIVSMADDEEMQGGVGSVVKRYNAVVRHLETTGALPAGLFQLLDEGSATMHQAAVESRMLSSYLEEIIEEEEETSGKPDFSPVIALAPFLDQGDLKALIHSHLSGRGFTETLEDSKDARQGPPDLKSLVALAPHLSEEDLSVLLESCLEREPVINPKWIVALAPHLNQQDLGRILRKYAPNWFGAKESGEPSQPPEPPGTHIATIFRHDPTVEPEL